MSKSEIARKTLRVKRKKGPKEPVQLSLLDRLDAIKTHEAKHVLQGQGITVDHYLLNKPNTVLWLKNYHEEVFEAPARRFVSFFDMVVRGMGPGKDTRKAPLQVEDVEDYFAALEEVL